MGGQKPFKNASLTKNNGLDPTLSHLCQLIGGSDGGMTAGLRAQFCLMSQ